MQTKKPPPGRQPVTKEITLDFVLSFKVKGYFCALLVSNIIGYLTILQNQTRLSHDEI